MSTVYGIDLGTTYSCVARVSEVSDTLAEVVANKDNEMTTPSVVLFERGEVVVGKQAKNAARLKPENVTRLFKREMGSDDPFFQIDGRDWWPHELSTLVLKKLVADAEQQGEHVEEVVITCPAYFGFKERAATRRAGEDAGLKVLGIISEPTAAAFHHGLRLSADEPARTVLVYDLGGGTFDVSVVRVEGGRVQVLATEGSRELGGADWDELLLEHVVERFLTENHGAADPRDAAHDAQELLTQVEAAKQALTERQTAEVFVRGGAVAAMVEIQGEAFDRLTEPLLLQTIDYMNQAVGDVEAKGQRIDDVLLVGGSSKMPQVAQRVRTELGLEPQMREPDLAVAKGAARFALIESVKVSLPGSEAGGVSTASEEAVQRVANQLGLTTATVKELVDKKITTVVPRAFGIKVIDSDDPALEREFISHLLEANTALPTDTGPQRYATVVPNQTEIKIEVWEQSGAVISTELSDNAHIGEGIITGLPPLPKGSPLDVTFTMDEVGTLRVHAEELSTGKDLHIELVIAGLDEDGVSAARDAVALYAVSE